MSLQRFADAPQPSTPSSPWALLAGAIDASQTTLVVTDETPFPGVSQFDILLDDELLIVTATGGTWTVTRGAYGTTAAAHVSGTGVYHVLTAAALNRAPRSMTTLGDMEYLGASGAPTRLAAPADGQWVVQFVSGVPSWATLDLSSYVTLNGTQTLTNKTLTTPTIANFNNANHSHLDSIGGGTLDAAAIAQGTIGLARISGLTVSQFASANVSQWTNDASYTTLAAVAGVGYITGASPTIVTPAITTSATITRNAIGTTSSDGLVLQNTTAATAGTQAQYGPRLRLSGTGWKGSGGPSQTVDWIIENQPQGGVGSLNAYTKLVFAFSVAGGSYLTPLQILTSNNSTIDTQMQFLVNTFNGPSGYTHRPGVSGSVFIGTGSLFNGTTSDAGVQLGSGSYLAWTSGAAPGTTDLLIAKDAADVWAQRRGTTAQTFRLYNTFTDSSNYERLGVQWSSNIAFITTESAGTGSSRDIAVRAKGNTLYLDTQAGGGPGITIQSTAMNITTGSGPIQMSRPATTATSGTGQAATLAWTINPSATSTLVGEVFKIAPTINYSNVTPGAGSYEALKIAVTETALPTGTNYLIRASAGSAGTTDMFAIVNDGSTYAQGGFYAGRIGSQTWFKANSNGVTIDASHALAWSTTANNAMTSVDTGLSRNAAGVVEVNSGTAGTLRDLLARKVTHTQNGVGTTSTDSVVLQNTTAATVGAQQYSGAIRFIGSGWKTAATAAAQQCEWIVEGRPTQSTTQPTNALAFTPVRNGSTSASVLGFFQHGASATNVGIFGLDGTGSVPVEGGGWSGLGSVGGGNAFGAYANGTQCFAFNNGGSGIASGQFFGFAAGTANSSSSFDLRVYREAADVWAQRRDTNAQTFRLYNTYTDASNYERLAFKWASNVGVLSMEKAGTGTARSIEVRSSAGGSWLFVPADDSQVYGVQLAAVASNIVRTTGKVNVGSNTAIQATSGTHNVLNIIEGAGPTSTSTMVFVPLKISPTINYSNATPGAGSYEALKIAVTETALPTGTNYLIRASAGSAGTTDKFTVDNNGAIGANTASANGSVGLTVTSTAFNPVLANMAGTWTGSAYINVKGNNVIRLETGPPVRVSILSLGMSASLNGSSDVFIERDAANTLALRNGTTAQTFNIYNTYTDASNYERGFLRFVSNVFEIGAEAAGTGTARTLRIPAGKLEFNSANGWISRTDASNGFNFAPSVNSVAMTLTNGMLQVLHGTIIGRMAASSGVQQTFLVKPEDRSGNSGVGHKMQVLGGVGQTSSTGSAGGDLLLAGGAAGGSGNNVGGNVYLDGGAPTGSGATGSVVIGATRGDLQITDARNVVLGTTTGTIWGTSTSQKQAWWNATPVVQQVLATGTGKTVDDVITLMQLYGLCRQS